MLTHPRRSLRHSPGMKIKRGTDANQDRRSQPALMLGHPSLLLRRAKPHPNDIRIRSVDQGNRLVVFGLRQNPKRRTVSACNLQTRKTRR